MLKNIKPSVAFVLAIIVLALSSLLAFWPGTSGGFVFDDYHSLSSLGDNGGIKDFRAAVDFALRGHESQIGRPLSRLSFTANANNWPADPIPFKVTNIIIHTANALLLFVLFFTVLRIINQPRRHAILISFIAAFIWAIHPGQISTVLYIVQRMAELSAFFIIIALLLYLYGRKTAVENPGLGYLLMSIAVVVFGILSILSKENGILITAFILLIEYTLLKTFNRPRHWIYWAVPVLGTPIAVIFVYFLIVIVNHESYYAIRDFNLYERLLTQARVLIYYLSSTVLPINTPTILGDHISLSKSIFSPISTFFSVLIIITSLILSIVIRNKQPVLSFGILWFFTAHLIESTLLPLEIYFEHRNYIPLIGPTLAFSYYLHKFLTQKKAIYASSIAILSILLLATSWHYSKIWSDKEQMVRIWVNENPQSARGKLILANGLLQMAQFEEAYEIVSLNKKINPDNLGIQAQFVTIACLSNKLEEKEYLDLIKSAATKKIDNAVYQSLSRLLEVIEINYCKQISLHGLDDILTSLLSNPDLKLKNNVSHNFYRMKAIINNSLKRWPQMITALTKSLEIYPNVATALELAKLHISAGFYEQAKSYIIMAKVIDDLRKPLLTSQRDNIDAVSQQLSMEISTSAVGQ